MSRVKADLPPPEALRAVIGEGGILALRVTPGARVEALSIEDGRVTAKVRARPEDGKANAAVASLLAAALGVAPSRITLLRGATSRDKQFQIPD